MKQTIIISIIAGLVFFTSGYALGGKLAGKSLILNKSAKGDNTFQAGWEAAKERVNNYSGLTPLKLNEGIIKNISGKVEAIDNGLIKIKIEPLEPLADIELDRRMVEIAGETKLYALELKDQDLYQKEMDIFNRQMAEFSPASEPVVPPEPFIKKDISLSEIKVGAIVEVAAVEPDIKSVKKFKAAEVTRVLMPVATAAPAVLGQ